MTACSSDDLLNSSQCFSGWGQNQLLRGMAVVLCKIWQSTNPVAVCDFNALLMAGSSMGNFSENQLLRIIAQLNCEILHAGGSGSGTCLSCGSGAPVNASTCACALYWDSDFASPTAGNFWWWDLTNAQWVQFIG